MTRLLPRLFLCLPAETNGVVQVKYTNPVQIPQGFEPERRCPPPARMVGIDRCSKVWFLEPGGKMYAFGSE